MKDDNTFALDVIKTYVREYKRTRRTTKIPLSLFDPNMTENIYINPYRQGGRKKHLIQSQRQYDDWIEKKEPFPYAITGFRLNDPITEVCEVIYDYAVKSRIEELGGFSYEKKRPHLRLVQ